jgi:hypothetical protein
VVISHLEAANADSKKKKILFTLRKQRNGNEERPQTHWLGGSLEDPGLSVRRVARLSRLCAWAMTKRKKQGAGSSAIVLSLPLLIQIKMGHVKLPPI